MSAQPLFRTGPIAHRSHVEINCKHDTDKILADERVWNNNGHVSHDIAWDFPGQVGDRSIYVSEVMYEYVENHIHGGDQQAHVRANLAGMLVPKLPTTLSAEERQREIHRRVWKMIRIVGIAVTDGKFDEYGAVNDPVGIVSGLISFFSPLRVTRGDLIMARLPSVRGTTAHMKRRPTIELVPLNAETIRTSVVDLGDMKNVLETANTIDFLKAMMLISYTAITEALIAKGRVMPSDAELRSGRWLTDPAMDAAGDVLSKITAVTPDKVDADAHAFTVTVNDATLGDRTVLNMDKLAEVVAKGLTSSKEMLELTKNTALPFSAVMMSLVTSKIMGVATKDCPERGRGDMMMGPVTRSLVDRVM